MITLRWVENTDTVITTPSIQMNGRWYNLQYREHYEDSEGYGTFTEWEDVETG